MRSTNTNQAPSSLDTIKEDDVPVSPDDQEIGSFGKSSVTLSSKSDETNKDDLQKIKGDSNKEQKLEATDKAISSRVVSEHENDLYGIPENVQAMLADLDMNSKRYHTSFDLNEIDEVVLKIQSLCSLCNINVSSKSYGKRNELRSSLKRYAEKIGKIEKKELAAYIKKELILVDDLIKKMLGFSGVINPVGASQPLNKKNNVEDVRDLYIAQALILSLLVDVDNGKEYLEVCVDRFKNIRTANDTDGKSTIK